MPSRIAVWIDHAEARVFHLHPNPAHPHRNDVADETTVAAPHHLVHRHPKDRSGEAAAHPDDVKHFFERIRPLLHDGDEILIAGPASAKHELFAYLEHHDATLASRVVGVEAMDHPSDPQIVAFASDIFRKKGLRTH